MGFKIIGGDIPKSAAFVSSQLGTFLTLGFFQNVTLKGNIERLEIITEESKKNFIGSAGWGLVGGLALGGVGLLAGVLSGGNKKEICFACYLKDGRKFLAVADPDTFKKIAALGF